MDKIIYTCSAEHIGFQFPNRKWWDFTKKPREARIDIVELFSGKEVDIQIRIIENMKATQIWIPPTFYTEIWQEFIRRTTKKRRYEVLLLVDILGDCFLDLLKENVDDVNYLAVLTQRPESYEVIMEELAQEFGLFGMIFTEYKDFVQYQRQICNDKNVLVWIGNDSTAYELSKRKVFLRFPPGSLVLDFDESYACLKKFHGKRMENDYVSIAFFLDNIIKNGYNSLVNEGLQIKKERKSSLQQNVSRTDDKNKLGEKRKGIRKWKKRKTF